MSLQIELPRYMQSSRGLSLRAFCMSDTRHRDPAWCRGFLHTTRYTKYSINIWIQMAGLFMWTSCYHYDISFQVLNVLKLAYNVFCNKSCHSFTTMPVKHSKESYSWLLPTVNNIQYGRMCVLLQWIVLQIKYLYLQLRIQMVTCFHEVTTHLACSPVNALKPFDLSDFQGFPFRCW